MFWTLLNKELHFWLLIDAALRFMKRTWVNMGKSVCRPQLFRVKWNSHDVFWKTRHCHGHRRMWEPLWTQSPAAWDGTLQCRRVWEPTDILGCVWNWSILPSNLNGQSDDNFLNLKAPNPQKLIKIKSRVPRSEQFNKVFTHVVTMITSTKEMKNNCHHNSWRQTDTIR